MSSLPVLSGRELVAVLEKAGFTVKRQKGSHILLRRNNPFCQAVVPDHKVLDRGTLRALLRQADISIAELEDLRT
ncbi:MAG: YcfA-like protein [Candidatus Hydrogenedentes bacterium ADurb.Bin101]|nr:MAG: YcfA-like protein [Candidatus Hydrogenedentes bacterium ADurb.Bin101]HOC70203.1 type II toxin-antitoxin system HicA family toxin [Candidatus Hydrogenedentota bacterium]